MKKQLLTLITTVSTLFAANATANGYTNWTIPTQVEIAEKGLLIKGSFGDPNECGLADHYYVSGTAAELDTIHATMLTAMVSQREVRFHASSCVEVRTHWVGNVINARSGNQMVMMR